MQFSRLFVAALAAAALSAPALAIEDHHYQVSREEYEQLIDGLIGAIAKGQVGVGGGGNGGSSSPGRPATPAEPGGNQDGDAGNDDQGDGIGESW